MTNEQKNEILGAIEKLSNKIDKMEEENKARDAREKERDARERERDKRENERDDVVRMLSEKVDRNHEIVMKELERQRQNTARMEHDLTEQIRGLYDQREINEERFMEQNLINEDVQETLDNYNSRIFRLEKINALK